MKKLKPLVTCIWCRCLVDLGSSGESNFSHYNTIQSLFIKTADKTQRKYIQWNVNIKTIYMTSKDWITCENWKLVHWVILSLLLVRGRSWFFWWKCECAWNKDLLRQFLGSADQDLSQHSQCRAWYELDFRGRCSHGSRRCWWRVLCLKAGNSLFVSSAVVYYFVFVHCSYCTLACVLYKCLKGEVMLTCYCTLACVLYMCIM